MPTISIELSGIDCLDAANIIRSGVDQVRHLFSDGDVINYMCTESWGGKKRGAIQIEPDYWSPELLGVAEFYILCLFALLAAFYFLHRRRASTRDVFYWGALALIVPILGPLITIVFYGLATRQNG